MKFDVAILLCTTHPDCHFTIKILVDIMDLVIMKISNPKSNENYIEDSKELVILMDIFAHIVLNNFV